MLNQVGTILWICPCLTQSSDLKEMTKVIRASYVLERFLTMKPEIRMYVLHFPSFLR